MNRIIVIAPHPDDEIIGCGGTLLKHVQDGDRVFVVFITNGELIDDNKEYEIQCQIRKNEAMNVAKESNMEIIYWSNIPARKIRDNYSKLEKDLIKIFRYIKPNIIYVPHENEKDGDHVLTLELAKEAYFLSKIPMKDCKLNSIPAQIKGYEVWSPIRDVHSCCDISSFMDKKKDLIKIYDSQMQQMNYADGVAGLNQYRAAFFGVEGYLEVFSVIST